MSKKKVGLYDIAKSNEPEWRPIFDEFEKFLKKHSNLQGEELIKQYRLWFKFEEIPLKDPNKSVWSEFTKDYPLGQSIQGYKIERNDKGEKVRIPYIGFSADLDDLDNLINNIIAKSKKMNL